ncbi:MAG: pyridoxal-phosphate dependent enzyme [Vicinamibacteraceae bacterium]|nr:pyridoxal-phosphate dependent enzyme [Vicinamibacteraceae bacterium]
MPRLVCHGCGAEVDAIGAAGVASECPRRGEGDADHVLRSQPGHLRAPRFGAQGVWSLEPGAHPFIHYRERLTAYAAARALGMSDDEFVGLVERLDARIADVEGRGLHATPTSMEPQLSTAAGLAGGALVVKVEAGQVSGSHKSRHLFGVALMLDVEAWARERGALPSAPATPPRLAIASCGNAALAAAVVARASRRPLDVFVPTWANAAIVEQLRELGATVHACPRDPAVPGDPSYLAFRDAVARGATPFCCQGPDCALTIEGGETLVWEMIDALEGAVPDAVFVQVGGGALASALARGFDVARRAGRIGSVPRIHAVQTHGCAPLVRAYDLVVGRILSGAPGARSLAAFALCASAPKEPGRLRAPRFGARGVRSGSADADAARTRVERARAASAAPAGVVDEALRFAATHRSSFMWPWEIEPTSLATGILDDETYDWLAIVEAMLRTGGYPVLASEATLEHANRLTRELTGVAACTTGTSGLAGLMDAIPFDERLKRERVAVVVSGRAR